jgi:TonB family protein
LPLSPFLIYDAAIRIRVTKLSKLLVIFAGVSLFASAGSGTSANLKAGAQVSAAEWQRYKVADEEFSVLLPVAPAMSTTSIQYERNKTRRERTLAAYEGGVVFLIETFEKKGLSFDELLGRTDSCANTAPVSADGVAGKGCNFEDEHTIRTIKFFATNKNLYKFSAVTSKLGNHATAISKFFSSISFSNKSNADAVVEGPGEQPLSQTDSYARSSEVTVRARVITKPEPSYTIQARQNQITGTVVLRAILSMSGAVENITVVSELPDGLTERAIYSARQIRFIPAIKDGRFVSTWIQLEYNFDLY